MSLEHTPWNFPFGLPPLGFKDHAFNAQTQQLQTAFGGLVFGPVRGPHFASRAALKFGADTPLSADATGRRSGQFRSPCGSDRRDPNTLAPNSSKARTTPLRT